MSLTLCVWGDGMSDDRLVTREAMRGSDFCLELFYWCSSRLRPPLVFRMFKSPGQGDHVVSPTYPRFLVLEHNLEKSFSFLFMYHFKECSVDGFLVVFIPSRDQNPVFFLGKEQP